MQTRRRWLFKNYRICRVSEFTDSMTVDTSLGQVLVTATVSTRSSDEIIASLESVKVRPQLPSGMTVRNCVAFLLRFDGIFAIQSIDFGLSLQSALVGSRSTGERLEAQEWSDGERLLVAGTEDGEVLDFRFPNLHLGYDKTVHYTPGSISLKLNDLPELYNPSFHFVIAENDEPELIGASAWCATDQDHKFLLSQ